MGASGGEFPSYAGRVAYCREYECGRSKIIEWNRPYTFGYGTPAEGENFNYLAKVNPLENLGLNNFFRMWTW